MAVVLDRPQPGLRLGVLAQGAGAVPRRVQAAMRARADAGIIAIAPIGEIVPAGLAGPGMVGNFIRRIAGFGGERLGDVKQFGGQ